MHTISAYQTTKTVEADQEFNIFLCNSDTKDGSKNGSFD